MPTAERYRKSASNAGAWLPTRAEISPASAGVKSTQHFWKVLYVTPSLFDRPQKASGSGPAVQPPERPRETEFGRRGGQRR